MEKVTLEKTNSEFKELWCNFQFYWIVVLRFCFCFGLFDLMYLLNK
jgi:hypothetical protein